MRIKSKRTIILSILIPLILYNLVREFNSDGFGLLKGGRSFISPLASTETDIFRTVTAKTDKGISGTVSAFKNIVGRVLGTENRLLSSKNLRPEIFGFLPFWTLDKKVYFRYDLLSVIAYFGIDVDSQGNLIKTRENGKIDGAWAGWTSDGFTEVINRARENKTKVLLTIKGFDNETIERLLKCSACRHRLVNNTLMEVIERRAHGVNIDFEYVGSPEEDIIFRFTQLVKDFTDAFHDELPGSYVTVSTYAKSATQRKIHDIKNLSLVADSIFVMGYDFFRPISKYAGPVAPLGGAEKYGYDLKTTVEDYLKVAPSSKIILGVPYYGYDWPVENNEPNARTLEGSDERGYPNMSSYVNSQYDPRNDEGSRGWDQDAQVPFYSWVDKERGVWRQVYYEDALSLSLKYDLIKEKGLRGVGIWALGYDGPYPELWDLLQEKFAKP